MAKGGKGRTIGSPDGRERKRAEKEARAQKRRRARTIRVAAVIAAVLVAGGGALFAVTQRGDALHDLSVVGAGVPVVVQVHDTTCPICTQLRANIRRIESEFSEEELLIRIADVADPEGLAFAARHTDQRRVTLLYFDADGRLSEVRSGLQTEDELRRTFRAHIGADS